MTSEPLWLSLHLWNQRTRRRASEVVTVAVPAGANLALSRGGDSHRRDCHSAASPSTFSRCFNRDGERASAERQSRQWLGGEDRLIEFVVRDGHGVVRDSNLGQQLLLPPADCCPMFAARATQGTAARKGSHWCAGCARWWPGRAG